MWQLRLNVHKSWWSNPSTAAGALCYLFKYFYLVYFISSAVTIMQKYRYLAGWNDLFVFLIKAPLPRKPSTTFSFFLWQLSLPGDWLAPPWLVSPSRWLNHFDSCLMSLCLLCDLPVCSVSLILTLTWLNVLAQLVTKVHTKLSVLLWSFTANCIFHTGTLVVSFHFIWMDSSHETRALTRC